MSTCLGRPATTPVNLDPTALMHHVPPSTVAQSTNGTILATSTIPVDAFIAAAACTGTDYRHFGHATQRPTAIAHRSPGSMRAGRTGAESSSYHEMRYNTRDAVHHARRELPLHQDGVPRLQQRDHLWFLGVSRVRGPGLLRVHRPPGTHAPSAPELRKRVDEAQHAFQGATHQLSLAGEYRRDAKKLRMHLEKCDPSDLSQESRDWQDSRSDSGCCRIKNEWVMQPWVAASARQVPPATLSALPGEQRPRGSRGHRGARSRGPRQGLVSGHGIATSQGHSADHGHAP